MKPISIIVSALAAFASGSPIASSARQSAPTIEVPCQKYDEFIHRMCQWQKKYKDEKLVGGFCGRQPSCLTAPQVQVKEHEYYFYGEWSGDLVDAEAIRVDCEEYDDFIDYKCQQQAARNPHLLGGWCGRPPVCYNSPFFVVNKSYTEFFQWKEKQ